jgi:MFS family permease
MLAEFALFINNAPCRSPAPAGILAGMRSGPPLLGDLPKNARTCILVEPLWSVFGGTIAYFAPLFQKALGLSKLEMGAVVSINIAFSFVFMILGPPVTNRLGRRRTSLIFDLVAWTLPMGLWALASSFAWFAAAAALNAVVKIVVVSWNLLLSEDASEADRSRVFGWINLSSSPAGIFTFLGGLLIARYGTVAAMRWIYAAGAVSMTAMFLIRYAFTEETANGRTMMAATKGMPLLKGVGDLAALAAASLRDRRFLSFLAIYFATNAVQSFDFYRILYLTEAKALDQVSIALIPAAGALVTLAAFATMRRLSRFHDEAVLAAANLLCIAAQASILLMPRGGTAWALAATGTLQWGLFLSTTHRDSSFMNAVSELRKSDYFGLVQALTLLLCIPTGALAGWLYSMSPAAPILAACLLYGLSMASALRISRARRRGSPVCLGEPPAIY